jgi:hypothetical protein
MLDLDSQLTLGLFIDPGYIDWQLNRLRFVVRLFGRDFFKGKKILEMGSYQGGITQMFHNLGANITGVEGSDTNLSLAQSRYPHLNFVHGDCEKIDWEFEDHYDIIIHWGLLYHLKYPERSVKVCLRHTDRMFLESLVVDRSSPELFFVKEDNITLPDQALNGEGARPSPSYVEEILHGHRYMRFDTPELNSRYQPFYDHPVGDTGEDHRRFWIVEK